MKILDFFFKKRNTHKAKIMDSTLIYLPQLKATFLLSRVMAMPSTKDTNSVEGPC